MLQKIKMFFTSKKYRKRVLNTLFLFAIIPVEYILSIVEVIKLYIKFPNKEERDAEIARREEFVTKEIDQMEEEYRKYDAIDKLRANAFAFNFAVMGYADYNLAEDKSAYSSEYLHDMQYLYDNSKKQFNYYLSRLAWLGIKIPDGYGDLINEMPIDGLKSWEEADDFADKLSKQILSLKI